MKRGPKEIEYACYKDDELICIGTLKEIAKYLGITYQTLKAYKYHKRYIIIKIED